MICRFTIIVHCIYMLFAFDSRPVSRLASVVQLYCMCVLCISVLRTIDVHVVFACFGGKNGRREHSQKSIEEE